MIPPAVYSPPVIVGRGHPRCGTGIAASLLRQNGLDVRHEAGGADGIISWMQVAKRTGGPWGETLAEYPPGAKVFLVARSPLAALNSVATENQQTRSIGFRSQLIWDRRGVDLFVWNNQTAGEGIYDWFGWAVMSMAYWYDICLEENPEIIFRIEDERDDPQLSEFVGRPITRDGKNVWQNRYGAHKKSGRLEYSVDELARVPKVHLAKLAEVAGRLGYPEDAEFFGRYL